MPQSLAIERSGFQLQRFADAYFGSAAANNKLMLSPAFCHAFRKYQYITFSLIISMLWYFRIPCWNGVPQGAGFRRFGIVAFAGLKLRSRSLRYWVLSWSDVRARSNAASTSASEVLYRDALSPVSFASWRNSDRYRHGRARS